MTSRVSLPFRLLATDLASLSLITMASTWKELKAEGNAAYSSGDLGLAVEKYTAALQTDISAADRATVLCNRAQCYLKQDQFSNAIEDCTACLTVSADNVKALFRRYGSLAAVLHAPVTASLLQRCCVRKEWQQGRGHTRLRHGTEAEPNH